MCYALLIWEQLSGCSQLAHSCYFTLGNYCLRHSYSFSTWINEKGAFFGLCAGSIVGIVRMLMEFSYSTPKCGEVSSLEFSVIEIQTFKFYVNKFDISCNWIFAETVHVTTYLTSGRYKTCDYYCSLHVLRYYCVLDDNYHNCFNKLLHWKTRPWKLDKHYYLDKVSNWIRLLNLEW